MRGAFGFQIINGSRMFYENRSRQDWNRLRSAYKPVYGKVVLNSLCSEEFNSYYVEDGDYWKIDNITLGYSFKNLFKSIYYGGATGRLYATVQNPFLITKYDGLDPEVSSGMDKNPYPRATTFLLGLSLQF